MLRLHGGVATKHTILSLFPTKMLSIPSSALEIIALFFLHKPKASSINASCAILGKPTYISNSTQKLPLTEQRYTESMQKTPTRNSIAGCFTESGTIVLEGSKPIVVAKYIFL